MIGVIDYGASNLQSVCNGLDALNQAYQIVSNPAMLRNFEKLILPGVGAAGRSMEMLRSSGFDRTLPRATVPVLGICLGLQLFADWSEENETECLSIVPGKTRRFPAGLKVPQIGWNSVEFKSNHSLLKGIDSGSFFYFVNSYYLGVSNAYTVGTTTYGIPFTSVLQQDNFFAVQFHPERSGKIGLQLLENFCTRC